MLTLLIAAVALAYLRGSRAVPTWRVVSFLVGLCLTWIAAASPIAALDRELLTFHMLQHLLLMTIAPPLIWMGEPVKVLFRSQWRWGPLQRLGHALANPTFCWLASAAALVGWHFPAACNLAMHSEAWHLIEHACFFAAGLLFWWPVVQPWPSASARSQWPILAYLFLATLPCDVLSGFLVFSDRVAFPMYLHMPRHSALSVLEDQQMAGALMWTVVTVVYLVAGTIFATRLLSPRNLETA